MLGYSSFWYLSIFADRLSCPSTKLACASGRQCYLKNQKCDGVQNCNDGSDESDCSEYLEYIINRRMDDPIIRWIEFDFINRETANNNNTVNPRIYFLIFLVRGLFEGGLIRGRAYLEEGLLEGGLIGGRAYSKKGLLEGAYCRKGLLEGGLIRRRSYSRGLIKLPENSFFHNIKRIVLISIYNNVFILFLDVLFQGHEALTSFLCIQFARRIKRL